MAKTIKWLDHNLEEFLLTLLLAMAVIMGVQVFSRFALRASLSWTEELTRYLFIWAGFLSASIQTKVDPKLYDTFIGCIDKYQK